MKSISAIHPAITENTENTLLKRAPQGLINYKAHKPKGSATPKNPVRDFTFLKNALNTKFLKFHSYLMEGFRIDLKTFLGLSKPNQCSQSKYQAGFGVIISGQPS